MKPFKMPLVEVSHLGIECAGKHSSNKKPRPIGIFRAVSMATEEEGGFEVMCPHCKRMVYISNHCLHDPERWQQCDALGVKYYDVSHRYQGK